MAYAKNRLLAWSPVKERAEKMLNYPPGWVKLIMKQNSLKIVSEKGSDETDPTVETVWAIRIE